MAIILDVNGVDRTSYIAKNSMRIVKKPGGQSSLDIILNCRVSDWAPTLGQTIVVYDDTELKYGGSISRISRTSLEPQTNSAAYTEIAINSNGYNNIASRRTINAYYVNKTAGFIFQNIVNNILNDPLNNESIGIGSITTGQTFAKYAAVCKSVKDVFDDLATQSGCQWYIDDNKDGHFVQEAAITTALYTIDASGTFTDFTIESVEESMENYTNKIFIKQSETVYTIVSDTAEQSLRKSAEGTTFSSGVYGKVIEVDNVTSATTLSTIGDNELKKYGIAPCTLRVKSYDNSWDAGQKVQVYQPKYGITSNTQFLVDELTISMQDNILVYHLTLVKRKSTAFSTQREFRGKEFFEAFMKSRSKGGGGGGIYTGVTNIIENYQVTNTADLSAISYTAGSTTITATAFETMAAADIHMTFSAKIQVTAAVTLQAITYLQEGAVTTSKTYSPIQYISSAGTFTYSEQFAHVSASATVGLTVKLFSDTGSWTISAGQSDMNVIVFPTLLTASYTAETITLQIATAITDTSLEAGVSPVLAVNPVNPANVFAGVKWIDTSDKWTVWMSNDAGNSWSDLSLPTDTALYTVGATSVGNVSLAVIGGVCHVAYQSHGTALTDRYPFFVYNAYNIAAAAWSYTSMQHVTSTYTYNLNTERFVRLVATASRVYLFQEGYSTFYSYFGCYSTDQFATRSAWIATGTTVRYGDFVLDPHDGATIHCVYETSAPALRYAQWSETSSAWSSAQTVHITDSAPGILFSKNIQIDDNSAVWTGAVYYSQYGNEWLQKADTYGSETYVFSLCELNSEIYGGTALGGKLLKWDGTSAWTLAADQYDTAMVSVLSLLTYSGEIWAGTGNTYGELYKWDGTSAWTWMASQGGFQSYVFDLCERSGYVFGAGGGALGYSASGNLLRFDMTGASGQWSAVAPQYSSQNSLYSVINFGSAIYASTYPNGYLLLWDNTSAWTLVAGQYSTEQSVRGLCELGSELYGVSIGGKLLKWDGTSAWTCVATALASRNLVSAVVYDSTIYAGSNYKSGLLKWDGTSAWTLVADQYGTEDIVESLLVYDSSFVFGGTSPGGMLLKYPGAYDPAMDTYCLYRKTAGATTFNAGWKIDIDNVVCCSMILDADGNPVIYYKSSDSTIYNVKFDTTNSAFDTARVSTAQLLTGHTYCGNIRAVNSADRLYMLYESGASATAKSTVYHYNPIIE